jgi:hypothetical protein
MTQDLEMAARHGGDGAADGPYYPPPRTGAGGEDLDDDGRKKRTGKPLKPNLPAAAPSSTIFPFFHLLPRWKANRNKNLGPVRPLACR